MTDSICFYYLPDIRRIGMGCCVYESFQKMRPHPHISNRWILPSDENPIEHCTAVRAESCANGSCCRGYSVEWRADQ